MADIISDEVKKLARLSSIALTEEEVKKYQVELSEILAFVSQLKEINTDGVKPTSQVTGLTNATRSDKEMDYGVDKKALLKNAPDQEDGYIKVRRVL